MRKRIFLFLIFLLCYCDGISQRFPLNDFRYLSPTENIEKIEGIDNIIANAEIKEHSSRSIILLPRLDFKINFEINFHEIALYVRLCDKNVNLIQNSLFVLAVRTIKVRACSSAYENKKMSNISREKSRKFVDGNSFENENEYENEYENENLKDLDPVLNFLFTVRSIDFGQLTNLVANEGKI